MMREEDLSLRSLTACVGGFTLLLHDCSILLLIYDPGFDVSVFIKTW